MTQAPCALYRQFSSDVLLYCGVSCNPTRRHSEHSSRASWFGEITRVEIEWFPSRAAALAAEEAAIATEAPLHNKALVRAGDPTVEVVDIGSWFRATGRKKADFAKLIGVSGTQLSQYISGFRRPSYEMMIVIEDATNGEVSMRSWARLGPSVNRNRLSPTSQVPA